MNIKMAIYAGIVATVAFCAAAAVAATVGSNPYPIGEKIAIQVYGRTITVQPFQMEQTDFTWEEMKLWLPQEMAEKPETPMSYREIYDAVRNCVKTTGAVYSAGVARITKESLVAEKGDDYTDMEYYARHKEYSDRFHVPGGEKLSQEVQEDFNRNLACLYVKDMLREAFHYEYDPY